MDSRLEVNDYLPMTRRRVWHSQIGNCEGYLYSSLGIPFLVLGPQCNYLHRTLFSSIYYIISKPVIAISFSIFALNV